MSNPTVSHQLELDFDLLVGLGSGFDKTKLTQVGYKMKEVMYPYAMYTECVDGAPWQCFTHVLNVC